MLQTGLAWLESRRHACLTHTVTYTRGEHSAAVAATVGKSQFDLNDGAGATIRVEARDYLIRAQDLIVDGLPIIPEPGDTITENLAGVDVVYEVNDYGQIPCWNYSDPSRITMRIHTKETGPAPSP